MNDMLEDGNVVTFSAAAMTSSRVAHAMEGTVDSPISATCSNEKLSV